MSVTISIYFDDTNMSKTLSSIGSKELLFCFFSNIAYHLENSEWGSRFPIIMKGLSEKGKIEVVYLESAKIEIEQISRELKQIPASKVIWDINNLRKSFPEGIQHGDEKGGISDFILNDDGEYPNPVLNIVQKKIAGGLELKRPVVIENEYVFTLSPDHVRKVNLYTKDELYDLADENLVKSFFQNIYYHLENSEWGSVYPFTMKKLYTGKKIKNTLKKKELDSLKQEILDIQKGFTKISPDKVIWDIEDPDKQPPWGKDISDEVKNISLYHLTNDGEYFFDVILSAINEAIENGSHLELE